MGETVANAVIYARYSSHGQQETSIEGQLKVCYAFCKRQGYAVIGEYIDRALTGRNDNRPEFQKMLNDAPKGAFQYIIVYQLDRFSRNRYDSAIHKTRLKKHGVRVLSANENIADDPSGILMESVLEGMSEYFSAELSVKVKRGMNIQAEQAKYVGGHIPFGYMIDENKKFLLNPDEAPIVRGIYEQYLNGSSIREICNKLNAMGLHSRTGKKFVPNSVTNMLHNEKYIGIYRFGDIVVDGGMPRIISDEVFKEAQLRFEHRKHAPASNRDVQYVLSGKLFCGECKNLMVGYCGTGKAGKRYYYYVCNGRRAHECDMDNVKKDYIEDLVLSYCRSLLDDSILDKLIQSMMQLVEEDYSKSELSLLEKQLSEIERKIQNSAAAIVECDYPEIRKAMYDKLNDLNATKNDIEFQIAQFTRLQRKVNETDVRSFFVELREGSYTTQKARQALIDTLINRVYIYKGKIILILNSGHKKELITNELLSGIESKADDICSSKNDFGTPYCTTTNTFCFSECFVVVILR